jgi:hypothetical protein
MSIVSNLHLDRRRIIAVSVVALVVAAIGGGYGLTRAAKYRAVVTVFVAQVLSAQASNNVSSAVADFQTSVSLKSVQQAAAASLHLPVSQVSSVSSTASGGGSAVTVSYTDPDLRRAIDVVSSVSRIALTTLVSQEVEAATYQVQSAMVAVGTAQQALASLDKQTGYADYESEYQSIEQNVLNLQDSPDSTTSQIAQQDALLNKLATYQPQYQILANNLTQAETALGTATQSLTTAKGDLAASSSTSILTSPNTSRIGPISSAIRIAVAGGVTAAIVTALVLAGLDRVAANPQSERRKADGSLSTVPRNTSAGLPISRADGQTSAVDQPPVASPPRGMR